MENAFFQINLDEVDYENFHKSVENIVTPSCSFRLCRVLFGITLSSLLLSSTLIKHINSYNNVDPDFVCKVLQSLHINDLNCGSENVSKTFGFFIKGKVV